MDGGSASELPLDQTVFCWKKISGPGKTDQSLCPFMGKRQSWRPIGPGPWQCSGSGLEGLGRDPIGWGQEGERDDCRDFFSVVLDSVCPKKLFFSSFSEMRNNVNV